jgi:hypothetical protein
MLHVPSHPGNSAASNPFKTTATSLLVLAWSQLIKRRPKYGEMRRLIILTAIPVDARNYETPTRSTAFCVVMPCSSGTARRFGGTHHLHLHGRRVSKPSVCFFLVSLFDPEDGGRVPPKRRALSKIHGVTTQKAVYFINIVQWFPEAGTVGSRRWLRRNGKKGIRLWKEDFMWAALKVRLV